MKNYFIVSVILIDQNDYVSGSSFRCIVDKYDSKKDLFYAVLKQLKEFYKEENLKQIGISLIVKVTEKVYNSSNLENSVSPEESVIIFTDENSIMNNTPRIIDNFNDLFDKELEKQTNWGRNQIKEIRTKCMLQACLNELS